MKGASVLRHAKILLAPVAFSLLNRMASAQESEPGGALLDETLKHNAVVSIFIGSAIVIALVVIATLAKNALAKKKRRKDVELPPKLAYPLFFSISAVILLVSLYVAGSTIYINTISSTKGPVHWHADFEIWNCGTNVDLVDPTGLSNRVGETVLHEHGDNRMHVEGVVVNSGDVSLGNFFRSVGGSLSAGMLTVQTNTGKVLLESGTSCPDGPAELQVFVYTTVEGRMVQEKLGAYEDYSLSGHSQVPPGDCIIIELAPNKETTDHLCESYKVAIRRGALNGG